MRVAGLYDIHGNAPALEAVLAEVRAAAPELVVIGGDVAGGPQPVETVELIESLELPALYVRGNGDRAPDPFEAGRLDAATRQRLAAWPLSVVADVDGLGAVRFCHATPRCDEELVTAISPDDRLEPILADVPEDVVVCGHVHVQYDRRAAGHRIVNAGSVGMAYEGSRDVAAWCLLGPDVELRQTAYDRDRFDRALASTGYPTPDWFDPADPAEVTAHFERLALEAAGGR